MDSSSACILGVSCGSETIMSTLLRVELSGFTIVSRDSVITASVPQSNILLVSRGSMPRSSCRAYSKVASARAIGTRMVRVGPLCQAALNRESLIESSCPLGFGITSKSRVSSVSFTLTITPSSFKRVTQSFCCYQQLGSGGYFSDGLLNLFRFNQDLTARRKNPARG